MWPDSECKRGWTETFKLTQLPRINRRFCPFHRFVFAWTTFRQVIVRSSTLSRELQEVRTLPRSFARSVHAFLTLQLIKHARRAARIARKKGSSKKGGTWKSFLLDRTAVGVAGGVSFWDLARVRACPRNKLWISTRATEFIFTFSSTVEIKDTLPLSTIFCEFSTRFIGTAAHRSRGKKFKYLPTTTCEFKLHDEHLNFTPDERGKG